MWTVNSFPSRSKSQTCTGENEIIFTEEELPQYRIANRAGSHSEQGAPSMDNRPAAGVHIIAGSKTLGDSAPVLVELVCRPVMIRGEGSQRTDESTVNGRGR